jgi:hypothetical protein
MKIDIKISWMIFFCIKWDINCENLAGRNAFGPSSGTICLSGLLIFVVRLVRSVVDNARQEGAPGLVNIVLRCCVNALLTAVDFLNKFTINFAAITGEAYCTSARMTYELLRRNLLSAVFVETISSRLLVGIVFVLSAIYTIVVCNSNTSLFSPCALCSRFSTICKLEICYYLTMSKCLV